MKTKVTLIIIFFAVISIFTACNKKSTNSSLNNTLDSLSYALGVNIGQSLKNESVKEINYDLFAIALKQSMEESKDLKFDDTKAIEIIQKYFQALKKVKFEKNLTEGKKFLDENKTKEGVVTLESGLQYKIITQGNGAIPKENDKVKTNYRGTLIDGREFDSSYGRQPVTFNVMGVIRGWTEALLLMPVGSKWMLYVPSELAYGANPRPGGIIEPNMALIFEIELLEIIPEDKK